MAVRVLVVDDTEHVRSMLADMLTLDGFDVVGQASDADSAVDVAQATRPDVAIMDLRLPGVDGIEATRRVRAACPGTSVILYTAYLTDEIRAEAAEAGAAHCLRKADGLIELERELSRLTLHLMREA
ncbi:MAG: putative two-component system response regulator [Frankiales bacterium]|nr:putative two-component system response regulator [Frankiales bacterium]